MCVMPWSDLDLTSSFKISVVLKYCYFLDSARCRTLILGRDIG